ncbi:hypothetical protein DMENIID0001_144820 [Sergentomyia squamirostris]
MDSEYGDSDGDVDSSSQSDSSEDLDFLLKKIEEQKQDLLEMLINLSSISQEISSHQGFVVTANYLPDLISSEISQMEAALKKWEDEEEDEADYKRHEVKAMFDKYDHILTGQLDESPGIDSENSGEINEEQSGEESSSEIDGTQSKTSEQPNEGTEDIF